MSRHNFFFVLLGCLASSSLVVAKLKASWNINEPSEVSAADIEADAINTAGYHSAILVAGSRGYWNYRHQADMCHAYQMLKKNGVPSDNIIIFVYDDIARNSYNPFPGKIYNVPGMYIASLHARKMFICVGGADVYPGCNKDYTGSNVNKFVLSAVLRGDSAAVRGKGSGRVLTKNAYQRVFFAYSDHGSVGYLPFPTGPYLYADEFNKLLIGLRQNSVFKEMLVYIEACDAGSMFYNMPIKDEYRIMGVSAAGAHESSYATYCPDSSKTYSSIVNPNKIRSCMGDLFTVAWIQDAEYRNVFFSTVGAHLARVTYVTSVDWTYSAGSHVYRYGDKYHYIYYEKIGAFLSGIKPLLKSLWNFVTSGLNSNAGRDNYKQTDADLIHLYMAASENNNSDASLRLEKELAMRKHTDEVIYSSLHSLIGSGDLSTDISISKFAEEVIPRGPDDPVVNDWDCLREMVDAWEDKCGRLNSYSGQYSRTFVNLCNAMVSPATFKQSLDCKASMYAEWDPQ
eukprot:g2311.t1